MDALDEVFTFVSAFAAENGMSDPLVSKLELAIEELFVNMVKHNPENRNDILISLSSGGGRLIASVTDFDVDPFDITKAAEYDSSQPLDKRPMGKLGIHLVRHMVDKISYEYENRQSKVTLIKDLGKANVQG